MQRNFLARTGLEFSPLEQQEKDLLMVDITKVTLAAADG